MFALKISCPTLVSTRKTSPIAVTVWVPFSAPTGSEKGSLFPPSPHYARIVAAAFAQRRKTLRNALSQILTAEQIRACGVDPGARPETLAPAAFNTLAEAAGRAALDRTGAGG